MTGFAALAGVVADWNDGHMAGRGGVWIFMILMMLLGVAVIGLVIWLIARSGEHRPPSGLENARAILAERLARGEIDPEEYRERLQHLQ
jgi:putative membrane protein